MNKRILLTGATGFLGSHLLESFISRGHEVSIIKRSFSNTWRVNHLIGKFKIYDIDKTPLKIVFNQANPSIIVHTACSYGRKNKSINDIISSNLLFGLQLLEESISRNVKTFVNADSLLPRNITDYSLSKSQFTDWLKFCSCNHKIQGVNLKIEHMYGVKDDSEKFIPWLINQMKNGDQEINLTSGIQKRDFIYVTDVVNAFNIIIQKCEELSDWNEFDVGTNLFTEVREFVLRIAGLLEKKYNRIIVPRLKFGSIPYRTGELMTPVLNNTDLVALGWNFQVDTNNGIEKIINYS